MKSDNCCLHACLHVSETSFLVEWVHFSFMVLRFLHIIAISAALIDGFNWWGLNTAANISKFKL